MADQLMLLPCTDPARSLLVRLPQDLAPAEAYRQVTGLIAALESADGQGGGPGGARVSAEEVIDALEEQGFESLDLILGPSLD
ncbi:hypothetical protein [uncultured Thiodictyon sp.]|uniref:hypothetical protein n=1 Tax=uncultured Thiodictyon sp. TaxID=1846217 RepID=UPI0025CC356A|nr:hypothetical protein [uncultured Thiodictyon sp.]